MPAIDLNELAAFFAMGIVMVGSPGPATLGLAASGTAHGFKGSLGFFFGLTAGMLVVIAIVAFGVSATVLAVPMLTYILMAISAAYFAYFAYKIATATGIPAVSTRQGSSGFLAGFFLNISSPKAYIAFGALFSSFAVVPESPAASAVVQLIGCVILAFIMGPLWLAVGGLLRTKLENEKLRRRVNIVFAAILVCSLAIASLNQY